jgi:hypothetical protein
VLNFVGKTQLWLVLRLLVDSRVEACDFVRRSSC